ncbi:helix-turn-helix transcriptional regulator [Macrococcus brunensis]|uniref:helix-turn-helix transcriptional regulator n=1 Tax=Macrococcus brunensis TaxID=198483 RepID=UPI001EEF833E|nr:helix-turn-helix transcriptional regulator [Macrococcus brunensis]ULG73181.1 helix-turn-helix transcriptional regulator [Macrococcus brunensis]
MDENIILTLEQWRGLRGLTKEELARKSGVTSRSILDYEKDVRNMENANYKTIKKLADALEIKVANIFLDSTSEKPKIILGG